MKLPTPYKCDYCDNTKRESNHWWLRDLEVPGTFRMRPWDERLAAATMDMLNEATTTTRQVSKYEHICSEACAVKALSKWMSSQK